MAGRQIEGEGGGARNRQKTESGSQLNFQRGDTEEEGKKAVQSPFKNFRGNTARMTSDAQLSLPRASQPAKSSL